MSLEREGTVDGVKQGFQRFYTTLTSDSGFSMHFREWEFEIQDVRVCIHEHILDILSELLYCRTYRVPILYTCQLTLNIA